jgi:hypothetical protein
MPYKDPEKARVSALERKRRYRQRLHDSRFGVGAGDMRGRLSGPARRGSANPRWNGGTMHTSQGYIAVKVPVGHHLRQAHGYAYEHQLVAEQMLGRRLRPNETVHHLNGDRADNRPENLEVIMRSEHAANHVATESVRDEFGRFRPGVARPWPPDLRVREMPEGSG